MSGTFPLTRLGGINENIRTRQVTFEAHFLYTGNLVCQTHFLRTGQTECILREPTTCIRR